MVPDYLLVRPCLADQPTNQLHRDTLANNNRNGFVNSAIITGSQL
jgi:hypothetical protein